MAVMYFPLRLAARLHAWGGLLLARALALKPALLAGASETALQSSLQYNRGAFAYAEREQLLSRRTAGPMEAALTGSMASRDGVADLWSQLRTGTRKPGADRDPDGSSAARSEAADVPDN